MTEPFTLLDEVQALRAELAQLTVETRMTRLIWVWKLSGVDRWLASCCATGCQWRGSEPTIALAGDLGRRHAVHHRAEIRPMTTTTHEEQE